MNRSTPVRRTPRAPRPVLLACTLPLLALLAGCWDLGPDGAPPTVRIEGEAAGRVVTVGTVELSGTFRDDRRVETAAYQVGAGPERALPITPGREVAWSATVELAPGDNRVRIVARDAAGNEGSAEVVIRRDDVTAPAIRLTDPLPESPGATVTLRGTVTDDVEVVDVSYAVRSEYDWRQVPIRRGPEVAFEVQVELAPGDNAIRITAVDPAGNRSTEVYRLRRQVLFTTIQELCGLTRQGEVLCGLGGELRTLPSPRPLTTLSKSYGSACGLAADGTALCTAGPGEGFAPTAGSLRFTQVAAGGNFACGLTADGRAHCWLNPSPYGEQGNRWGQLGTGGTDAPAPGVPVAVAGGLTFRAVSASAYHACGLTAAGEAYCWGSGYGTAPSRIAADVAFDAVFAGPMHSCATTAEKRGYCWTPNDKTPRPMETDVRFVRLALGTTHYCGIAVDGRTYCWGNNFSGQVGIGTQGDRSFPALVAGGHEFTDVSVSGGGKFGATCAVTRTGEGYCWGQLSQFNTYNYSPKLVP